MGFTLHVWCFLLALGSIHGQQLPINIPGTSEAPAEKLPSTYLSSIPEEDLANKKLSAKPLGARMADSGNCTVMANLNGIMTFLEGENRPEYQTIPAAMLPQITESPYYFINASLIIKTTYVGKKVSNISLEIHAESKSDSCTLVVFIKIIIVDKDNEDMKEIVDMADTTLKKSGSKVTNIDCGILKKILAKINCKEFCTKIYKDGNKCVKSLTCTSSFIEISEKQFNIIKSMKSNDGNPANFGPPAEFKSVTCYKAIGPDMSFVS